MIGRLFIEHPRSLGMSWLEHGVGAAKIGGEMIGAGAACMVHALVPGWFTETAGRTVDRPPRSYGPERRRAPPTRAAGPTMKSDEAGPPSCDRRRRLFRDDGGGRSWRGAGSRSVLIEGGGSWAAAPPIRPASRRISSTCAPAVMSAWPDDLERFRPRGRGRRRRAATIMSSGAASALSWRHPRRGGGERTARAVEAPSGAARRRTRRLAVDA